MRIRKTARAVLFDPDNRVLLFEFVVPKGYIGERAMHFWATPGGEIEPSEDVRVALERELREETGFEGCQIGPELWFGSNELKIQGHPVQTFERFFFVRSPACEIQTSNWTEIERQIMRNFRWWIVQDLCTAQVTIFPPRLGPLIEKYLQCGSAGPEEISL